MFHEAFVVIYSGNIVQADLLKCVLEGEGILTVGKEEHLMRPHDYVYLPPGVPHSFTNTGLAGLVFLVVTTPAEDK